MTNNIIDIIKRNPPLIFDCDFENIERNQYAIIHHIKSAIISSSWKQEDVRMIIEMMKSSDYDNLIYIATQIVNLCNNENY